MNKIYEMPLVKVVKVEVEKGFADSYIPVYGDETTSGVGIQSFSEDDENGGWAF